MAGRGGYVPIAVRLSSQEGRLSRRKSKVSYKPEYCAARAHACQGITFFSASNLINISLESFIIELIPALMVFTER